MASTQDNLLDDLAALTGDLNAAMGTTQTAADWRGGATTDYGGLHIGNTDPPAQTGATRTAPSSSTSGSSTGTSAAMLLLESGFGLAPLIAGLVGLFGGGAPSAPPPLAKYAMPRALDIEAAATGQGLSNADYDQTGMPRAYDGTGRQPEEAAGRAGGGLGSASAGGAAPAQITVNVQAMDARSFMDRSADIAAAVRDAMLNLNSINDVVSDL
jgi:hypothetical protein